MTDKLINKDPEILDGILVFSRIRLKRAKAVACQELK